LEQGLLLMVGPSSGLVVEQGLLLVVGPSNGLVVSTGAGLATDPLFAYGAAGEKDSLVGLDRRSKSWRRFGGGGG